MAKSAHTPTGTPPPGDADNIHKSTAKQRARLGDGLHHFHRLLNADLGDSPSRSMEVLSYLIRLTRETIRELARTRCFLRSSALAYSTILSLVPLLAVVMALLSMPALSAHRERVINQIVNGLTPSIDEKHFWGEKGIQRYVRVTVKDPVTGATQEIVGEQLGEKGFPNYPEDDQKIKIRRAIALPPGAPGDDPLVVRVGDLESAYTAEEENNPRIGVVGLGDQGRNKATVYAYLNSFTAKAGAVGVIGFLLLMYIVYTMLSRIENTFSEIWSVSKRRNFFQRISLYTALVFWGPILMIAATAGLEFLAHLDVITKLGFFAPLLLRLVGLCVTVLVLTAAYIILPNMTVKFRPAFTGGVFAAVLWTLATYGFSSYLSMTGGGSYQRVYGTLGLLPVMLILIYMSWVILLFGAVVCFTIQNFRDLDRKRLMQDRAVGSQVYMALRLCVEVVRDFRARTPKADAPVMTGTVVSVSGRAPVVVATAAKKLGWRKDSTPTSRVAEEMDLPPYAVAAMAEKLVSSGILIEAAAENGRKVGTLLPACEPDLITAHDVINLVRPNVMEVPDLSNHPERDSIAMLLKSVSHAEEHSLEGLSIGQLTRQLDQAKNAASTSSAPAVQEREAIMPKA